ncbi:uncharacterized protein M421DRAFT_1929 [Didymella exigua CBS 183.55]|uniref:F-box domain-containing protein n=1 Tax=Didymella exigua CBS 183.55 TaxID=1150837 RepID=A0A6A5RWN5_9PLEO|nr:uncharacterized protein M421DRAFT_1929 [Didymella exigua CBS 183.55]KAF1932282.1 hypothetical protein M421DRAFT_1929 [Didymella exigua CBS 183.55]
MVGTRSKARRASTPLSSPPASPPPSLSGSEASTGPALEDDATVSIKADSQYESSDSNDGFDSDYDSDSDHKDHCSRHTSEQATKCNGRTYSNQPCKYKGRIAKEGHFPVCGQHRWYQKRAGQCQAIEKCGHPCNRLTAYTPPFFFCAKHEHDTNLLPCHIMRLPTELRLIIFRYLLPKVVEATSFNASQMSVLTVSRQFYQEASAVVYGELQFKAEVHPTTIALFGRRWHRESTEVLHKDLGTTLCQVGARRIRHLEVEVNFGDKYKKIKGIGAASLTHEDYEMYQVRDTVRKLVQLLLPESAEPSSKALQHLKVKSKPAAKQQWQSDEIIAAIFLVLDPFLALSPIEDCALLNPPRPPVWPWRYANTAETVGKIHEGKAYRRLRKQWLGVLRGSLPKLSIRRSARKVSTAVAEAYSKIEDFTRLIYAQDASQFQGQGFFKHGWTGSSFQGIERVLHNARVAYEDDDLETLQNIHYAIMNRWVKAHARQQQSLAAVATAVSNMFDDVSAVDTYDPKAFEFNEATSSEDTSKHSDAWLELNVKSTVPKLFEPGVTYKEEGARVIVCKEGEERVWLKTPCVARQVRAYNQMQ